MHTVHRSYIPQWMLIPYKIHIIQNLHIADITLETQHASYSFHTRYTIQATPYTHNIPHKHTYTHTTHITQTHTLT